MNCSIKIALLCTLGVLAAGSAGAQQSRCADCHFANPTAPRRDHLNEWDRSPHARNDIGCDRCHGGNPKVFEGFLAHRGIVGAYDKTSPVNPRNQPATCGRCHLGPLAAFRASTHFKLLESGDGRGPTCATCHGAAGGQLLSPKALAAQCDDCHGPREEAPRAERARLVREQYEGLKTVREEITLAQSLIKRVDDKKRRADLADALQQAQVPLTRAIDAGHAFVYDEMKSNLAIAQQRIDALLASLANRP